MNLNKIARYITASVMIVFLFVIGTFEMKASACKTGFTPRTVNMTINGCLYEVNICVKCATGPAPAEIYLRDFSHIVLTPECEQTWTIQQVLDYISQQISTYNWINTYLCDFMTAPPCPNLSEKYKFYHWVCWNIEKIYYSDQTHIIYRACDYDNYCEEEFRYCYDPILRTNVKTRVSGPTLVGSINCTLEGHEVEVPEYYNYPSDCFIYHTPCNP